MSQVSQSVMSVPNNNGEFVKMMEIEYTRKK
jgi:hypothetical protein